MRRKGLWGKTVISAIAAASLLLQGTTVLADSPLEELQDIMEDQQEAASESLLEQTLGLHDLGEAIEELGLNFGLKASLSSGTAETLGISDQIPEDGYVSLGLQVNPEQKAWSVTAGAGEGEESILDLELYGERDLLALCIPQIYTGALGIRSGNLKEQYESSALAQILGEQDDIPDMDLKFYPDEADLDIWDDFFDGLEDGLEDRAEALENAMQVEKETDGEETIYRATVSSEDIMGLYADVLKEYFALLEESGLLAVSVNSTDYETQIDEMLEQLGSVLEEDVTVEFDVCDNLVQEIRYDIACDTTKLAGTQESSVDEAEEAFTEIVEESLEPAGNAENAASAADTASEVVDEASDLIEDVVIGGADAATQIEVEANPFQGVLSYDFVYWDPSDPSRGFYMNMTATDAEGEEVMGCYIDWTSVIDETSQSDMLYLRISENDETIYEGMPYYASFDQESGEYNVTLSVTDEEDGDVSMNLYSSFTDIVKGKSFVWNIDELNIEGAGISAGITAQIQVGADPGEIEAPQDIKMILELSQEELMTQAQEISVKAALWAAQFENSTETQVEETEDVNSGV